MPGNSEIFKKHIQNKCFEIHEATKIKKRNYLNFKDMPPNFWDDFHREAVDGVLYDDIKGLEIITPLFTSKVNNITTGAFASGFRIEIYYEEI